MRSIAVAVLTLLATACAADDPDGPDAIETCHFVSGRPCEPGELCMGTKGGECNYYTCTRDGIVGSAIGCFADEVEPVEGGPFNCDPATVVHTSGETARTPPNGWCPIGSLYALNPESIIPYLFCVPLEQCAPIACDPQWNGDGCPSGYGCDAATETCVAL
jgi:hypothetical protein